MPFVSYKLIIHKYVSCKTKVSCQDKVQHTVHFAIVSNVGIVRLWYESEFMVTELTWIKWILWAVLQK